MSYESIRNTISLAIITIVAGLLLGLVYEVTKDPIRKQQQKAKEEAYKEVFAEAVTFEDLKTEEEKTEKLLAKQGINATINEAMKVLDKEGVLLGYVLTVTDHEGYGGDIRFAMGVKIDGTVNGISFLAIGETAGLGMKAKDDAFKNQFANKKVESFVYTKGGASKENEIDAISGATITTNAVTNGVNAGLYYISTLDKEAGK